MKILIYNNDTEYMEYAIFTISDLDNSFTWYELNRMKRTHAYMNEIRSDIVRTDHF